MIKRTLLTAVVAAFATGFFIAPALASHCPRDVKAIDAALKMTKISDAQMSKVKALRDKGNAEHSGGKHGDSIKSLHEAMTILGIAH
jgi:hypothetical protein